MTSTEEKFKHPECVTRLASSVYRFRVPIMTKTVSFARSFKTSGRHPMTFGKMTMADVNRQNLKDVLETTTVSGDRVYSEAMKYLPLINQILLTCKVQPEMARLDEQLMFEWKSGIENAPSPFTSEALIYDLVMTCVCLGFGKTISATESSLTGDFAAASREFAAASGIFESLAKDHLPKWIAKGTNLQIEKLPIEATVNSCEAFKELFLANGQQMAIATVLKKPGIPNYSLVAKLCLGVSERLESFQRIMRKNSPEMIGRLDKDLFTFIGIQLGLQRALTLYFHSRGLWGSMDYGCAIAMLREAKKSLDPGNAERMPEIPKNSPFAPLLKDIDDLKTHMILLIKHYEEDNSIIYFESIPQVIPESKKLQTSVQLTKCTAYTLPDVDPLPLMLP
jgi:hypothetical protein